MKKRAAIIAYIISTFLSSFLFGQNLKLQSAKHGLDLINNYNVPKELIIDDVRFANGKDEEIDILRFDNVGTSLGGDGPLILSSKEAIQVDSLGLTPIKLQVDSLRKLMAVIHSLDSKIYGRLPTDYQFRITYRFGGKLYQYYVGQAKESSTFFKKIEYKIKLIGDKSALEKFYHFLQPSRLIVRSPNGLTWVVH